MERNSTNLSMKDQQRNIAMRRNNIPNNNNIKDHSRNHHHVYINNISQSYHHEDQDFMMNGFSWPPRSYTCNFCKREFRSAQALGGHMNVHRKDRARLRQSPPRLSDPGLYGSSTGTTFLNLNLNNPNPNPNPNFSLTSPPLSSPYSAYSCPNNENKKWSRTGQHVEYSGMHQLDHHQHLTINGSDLAKVTKSKQSVCAVGDDNDHGFSGKNVTNNYKSFNKADQAATTVRLDLEIGPVGADSKMGRDLDLELRLGYSNY